MGPRSKPLHSCDLQFLTWKVAFLVAITFLRLISKLQALTLEAPFLPKVVSFHLNQTVELPFPFQYQRVHYTHLMLEDL